MLFRLMGLSLCLFTSLAQANENKITLSGSTSVSHILEVLAEQYEHQKGVLVEVQGTGSSAGIASVNNETSELGMSSRYLKSDEIQPDLKTHIIAYDGIVLVVNPENPIVSLSPTQISDIYHGEVGNWQQVGGDDRLISVVSRESASGSRYSFESMLGLTKVYKGETVSDVSPEILVVNSNSMVKTMVANNRHAVGYISLGSVDDSVRTVLIDNSSPSIENIVSGKYKLARPFIILHKKDGIEDRSQRFIDFLMSRPAQTTIQDSGYVPVSL